MLLGLGVAAVAKPNWLLEIAGANGNPHTPAGGWCYVLRGFACPREEENRCCVSTRLALAVSSPGEAAPGKRMRNDGARCPRQVVVSAEESPPPHDGRCTYSKAMWG